MWNERRAVKDQMRYIGTIESMVLVTEWHPRSSHMPGESDYPITTLIPNTWLQEVEEIAERSDRASWMLLGNALTLSHEIDIIEVKDDTVQVSSSPQNMLYSEYLGIRRSRLRRILYIYISQMASRLGCSYPKTPFHQVVAGCISHPKDLGMDEQWHNHVSSWIELSRLIRSSSEFLFPSKAVTKELLRSGRYGAFLDHFRPLLDQWQRQHSGILNDSLYHQLLMIDYHFVRLYINSLALQAIFQQAQGYHRNLVIASELEMRSDFAYVREVIDGCSQILQMVIHLAEEDHLKYMPTRLHIRFASAAIYLIHALALGVRRTELDSKIALVDTVVRALRVHTVDDVHLSVRYASLLYNHLKGLRQRFVRVHSSTSSFPLAAPQFGYTADSLGSEASQRIPDSTPESGGQLASAPGLTSDDTAMPVSGTDWLVMPVETTNQTQQSDFMQLLFEIDSSDRRFFWDFLVEGYVAAPNPSLARVSMASERVMELLGTRNLDELRAVPTEDVRAASLKASGLNPEPDQLHTPANLQWYPVPDGDIISEDLEPLSCIAVLFGTTADEMRGFYRPNFVYGHPDIPLTEAYSMSMLKRMTEVQGGQNASQIERF
ncbi:fungal zn binuclear cluster domain containing [Trichoderma arundinaceum]|uniref:Fungal zn binuclear cluster domain containing n=1 Tax=Trichoderma arundinaceum TaxID=490622 RepID=A0A395NE41_TRIAR|nr:fungal zn binuclear cluster domain containing [Trichoderma arundinaceum]